MSKNREDDKVGTKKATVTGTASAQAHISQKDDNVADKEAIFVTASAM